jgi:hypothetical protein
MPAVSRWHPNRNNRRCKRKAAACIPAGGFPFGLISCHPSAQREDLHFVVAFVVAVASGYPQASEAAEKVVLYQGTAFSRAASVLFCYAASAAEVRFARGTDFFSTLFSLSSLSIRARKAASTGYAKKVPYPLHFLRDKNSFFKTAQKSHVKPQNHLTQTNETRLTLHVSPVQSAIIKTVRKKEREPRQMPGLFSRINLLNGRLCSKEFAKMGLF